MKILAIDSSSLVASCALIEDEILTAELTVNHKKTHSQTLLPLIDGMFRLTETEPEELDAIAVSGGPGSFTGIRIGMATAKALAQVWDKPVICVPTLQSFAFCGYGEGRGERLLFCPMFDARRSQVYAGAYEPGSRTAVVEDSAWDPDELISRLREVSGAYDRIVFFGDGIEPWKEKIEGSGLVFETAPEDARYQTACQAARLAAVMYGAGELCDCYTASPEYLRLAEAERKLAEKDR